MRKLAVFIAILCATHAVAARTIWIDTDVSIGSPIREVDDAYALLLAFHSTEIRIAGISTTYGNASLGRTNRVARDFVQRFGAPAGLRVSNVFAGPDSPRARGQQSAASEALASALRKEKLTYVALGPLTNLATFLQLHPKLAGRIERVVFLGGQPTGDSLAFGPTRSFHIHDANVFKDPAAVETVLRSRIPLTLLPIETSGRLLVNTNDLRELSRSGPAGEYLARRSQVWLWFWTQFVKTNGGPIFDALGVVSVTRPELLTIRMQYARMDEAGNLLITTHLASGARQVRSCAGFAAQTKSVVLERLRSNLPRDDRDVRARR
jgi:pyrimidine-specific ribonucleoside hydrolase